MSVMHKINLKFYHIEEQQLKVVRSFSFNNFQNYIFSIYFALKFFVKRQPKGRRTFNRTQLLDY